MGNLAIKDDSREVTYRDLWCSCASYQKRLRERGYGQGDRVCLLFSWDHCEDIFFLLACVFYGLSVHILPFRKGVLSLSKTLSVWSPQAYFVTPSLVKHLKGIVESEKIFFVEPSLDINEESPSDDLIFSPDKECVVLQTSGTNSADMRLVSLSFENLFYSARGLEESAFLSEQSVWYLGLPVYHIAGLSIIFRCFFSFCCVYVSRLIYHKAVLSPFLTHFSFVQAQIATLLEQDRFRGKKAKTILIGGGFIAPVFLKEMKRRRWPILCGYGMTETCSPVAVSNLESDISPLLYEILPYRQVRIGQDQGIEIKGHTVCYGYYDQSGFHKVSSEDYFLTQDRGYLTEEGCLVCLGRVDDIFKSYGVKIVPSDIEEKVLSCSGVSFVKVFPMLDLKGGQVASAVLSLNFDDVEMQAVVQFVQELSGVDRVYHLYLMDSQDYLPDKFKRSDLEKMTVQWRKLY